MSRDSLVRIFQDSGAFLEGHFVLASGLHSSHYIQCARLFENPGIAEALVEELAAPYALSGIEWVVGPALGGILPAYELARTLHAKAAFTERVDGKMTLRRGFLVPPKSKVLVAEDVLTTGGSALEVARHLETNESRVVGVTALVDRGEADFPYPKTALISLKLDAVPAEQCALCKAGRPVTKPGSRS